MACACSQKKKINKEALAKASSPTAGKFIVYEKNSNEEIASANTTAEAFAKKRDKELSDQTNGITGKTYVVKRIFTA